ncbi:MAG TPA: hypothetical protein VFU63_03405 [Ktedonobacterales bacterium]|nr:hypothetical protein [Ktedonobacterales bacterium]
MRIKRRHVMLGLSGLALLSLFTTTFFVVTQNSHAAASHPPGATGVIQHAKFLGTTSMHVSGTSATASSTGTIDLNTEIRKELELDEEIPHSGHGALRVPADQTPKPAMNNVVTDATAPGFSGITHADQRLAGTGIYAGTQFSLEPPDQALCVGNGFVLESINTALRVYHTDGTPAGDVLALNQFFKVTPEIDRVNLVFGDFTSDPKCYYDAPTSRWFVTVLQADVNPTSGAFAGPTSVLIAVSQSPDPTGGWNLFSFDTTDGDGTLPGHPGCPCLGDQPLIGADANGFYVSTNEFPLFSDGFNGAQVYAISKSAIETATSGSSLNILHINAGVIPTPDVGGIWYSIQPAIAPGSSYEGANNGTEYFMSSLQFGPGALDNRIAVWALTNTSALGSATPTNATLSHVVIDSEVYGQPPDSAQKDGPLPLASNITALTGIKTPPNEKLAFLAGNDDRMNQVVFADGKLWSGVNTVVSGNGPTRVGIAYFIVSPSDASGTLSATMAKQGYVALAQNDVLYPSIGVTAAGKGVMTFTVAGPDFFPSAGYARIDATDGAGDVHIAAAGAGPEDGFTAYSAFGGTGTARWGDYSAAVADEHGVIWFACEYIPDAPRTVLANWGTFVGNVAP